MFDVALHIREQCEALLSTPAYSHRFGICYYMARGLDRNESRDCVVALLQAFAEWPECHLHAIGTPNTTYPVAGYAEYRDATSGSKWDANTTCGAKRWRLVRYLADYFSTTLKEDA